VSGGQESVAMASSTLIFLIQALAIVVVPAAILRFSGLKGKVPLVIVQIAAGIMFGPSVLGRLAPEFYARFFNPASLAAISGVASIAVLLFGLITGLHLGPEVFSEKGRMFSRVAAASLIAPTLLGCLAGYWLLERHPAELLPGVHPGEFAMSVGLAVGMTALPVLGMILKEMDQLGSFLGRLALAVAGLNDVVLWGVFGVLLATHSLHAGGDVRNAMGLFAPLCVPLYLALMVWVARPLLLRWVTARMRNGAIDERALAVVIAATIVSGVLTELMGLDYTIGAFVTGVVMPHSLRKPILDRLEVLTVMFLMPFFFFATGLRTSIDPGQPAFVEIFFVATVVAVTGVWSSAALAARANGASWTFAAALGALLQAKGMMEVLILTVLLNVGIISSSAFAALVLMGVFCTAIAMPLAQFILGLGSERDAAAEAIRCGEAPLASSDVATENAGGFLVSLSKLDWGRRV